MIEYFLIFLILCFLISLFIYFRLKKNDDEFDKNQMLISKNSNTIIGKSNMMKDHLALALLEREKILNTNGLLPGSNNSICYGLDGKKIKGCKCHPTCKTCGYGKDPKGMNQCLTCINGSDVNSLYRNGAGWCSIENSKKPSMKENHNLTARELHKLAVGNSSQSTGTKPLSCNSTIIKLCGLKNKYDNNGDYSGWDKCLKDNEKKLLMGGCQFDKDYKIKEPEPYKCEECKTLKPFNKDIGSQKCCSGDNCHMRRCSVSTETEKGGVVTNIGSETSTSTTGYYHKEQFASNFSIIEDGQGMERKITVTFKITDKIIPEKSQITISNLANVSTTKNTRLKIAVTSPSNPSTSIFGSTKVNPRSYNTGSWNKVNGYLILTVSDGVSIPANTDVKFSFNLKLNSSRGRDYNGITPKASLISGDDTYRVMPQVTKEPIFKWGRGTITTTNSEDAASSGYCTDLENNKTITTTSYFDNQPTSSQCTGDYTLAVKNEVQCNKITDQTECGSNKTCTWDSTNNACRNDNWNKWFCSKPKNKCGEKWSHAPGFFNID